MLFVKLSDYSSSIEAVVFPKLYKEFESVFTPDNCIAIKGRYSMRNGTPSIVMEKVKALQLLTVRYQIATIDTH